MTLLHCQTIYNSHYRQPKTASFFFSNVWFGPSFYHIKVAMNLVRIASTRSVWRFPELEQEARRDAAFGPQQISNAASSASSVANWAHFLSRVPKANGLPVWESIIQVEGPNLANAFFRTLDVLLVANIAWTLQSLEKECQNLAGAEVALWGDIQKNWNDPEKISMAPAQGWHAFTEW